MNKKRIIDLLWVLFVYILATVVGIITYNLFDLHHALKLLVADVIATIVVFIFSLIFKNASMYDPYWSVQPIVIVLALFVSHPFNVATLLALIAICIWGVRLTINWCYTFSSFEYQDWRYLMLKEKTKKFYPIINFLGIHMFPTLVVYLCVLPVSYLVNSSSSLNVFTVIFFVIALFSVLLQTISDYQMHKFRKQKTGKLIRVGLWKYSRHPNYLAEILMWWSIGGLCVFTLMDNYYLLAGALVNTIMFLCVSIPMAEKRNSKRIGYAQYKKETRMLLPIYKKVK